jgi:hypothetical protein
MPLFAFDPEPLHSSEARVNLLDAAGGRIRMGLFAAVAVH